MLSANNSRMPGEDKSKKGDKPKDRKLAGEKDGKGEEEEGSEDSVNSDEYEFVHGEEKSRSSHPSAPTPLPAYQFPGTWTAALHDTALAATAVSTATTSYYTSLKSSGLAQASRSIGGALINTANRSALTAANFAADVAGTDRSSLPTGVKSWMKGKEKMDEARRKAEEAARKRLEVRVKRELIERGEVVEVGRRRERCGSEVKEEECSLEGEGVDVDVVPLSHRNRTPRGPMPTSPAPVNQRRGSSLMASTHLTEDDNTTTTAPIPIRMSASGFEDAPVRGSFTPRATSPNHNRNKASPFGDEEDGNEEEDEFDDDDE